MRYAKVPIVVGRTYRGDIFAEFDLYEDDLKVLGSSAEDAVKRLLDDAGVTEIPADIEEKLAKAEAEVANLNSLVADMRLALEELRVSSIEATEVSGEDCFEVYERHLNACYRAWQLLHGTELTSNQ